jgi:peptidoglycan-N-acetylglucosamine deacetylase
MNILTFDVEDWFHLLDFESTKTINEWVKYESRIQNNIQLIFSILEKYDQKATFFCMGWIAETYPEVIKEIANRGFEIGSHTRMHQLIYLQTPKEFKDDLEYSIKTLEDLSSQKVKYFRAPGFSIREDNKWALEVMTELGIEVDSSIFPAPRAHGGFPSYIETGPAILEYNGLRIKEFPINFKKLAGNPIIFSGGGYFRLLPYAFIKRWTKESSYTMSYLHPRDFDASQPILKDLSITRKFKSYVGLKGSTTKLERWLTDFEFVDIETAIKQIDWGKVPIVKL